MALGFGAGMREGWGFCPKCDFFLSPKNLIWKALMRQNLPNSVECSEIPKSEVLKPLQGFLPH